MRRGLEGIYSQMRKELIRLIDTALRRMRGVFMDVFEMNRAYLRACNLSFACLTVVEAHPVWGFMCDCLVGGFLRE